MDIFGALIEWLVGKPVQALITLVTLAGIAVAIWKKVWRLFRKPAATKQETTEPVVDEATAKSEGLASRLAPILDELGDHIAGLGHVMSVPAVGMDAERRYKNLDELFGDYEVVRVDLHLLVDMDLAQTIKKTVRNVRTDYLESAKREIESTRRAVENRQGVDWLKPKPSHAGQLLETQGRNLKILARSLRKLHPESEETPKDTWTAGQLKRIADDYWRDNVAHCPVDGARLTIAKDDTTSVARLLMVVCVRCGRKAANVS